MPLSPTSASRLVNRVRPPDAPGLSGLLGLAVAVVIIAALSIAREVLVPITLAILLSFVLGPVVALLRRLRLPRLVAVLLAALVALGVVSMVGAVIGAQVAQLSDDVPRYASTIEQKVSQASKFFNEHLSAVTNGIGEVSRHPAPAAPNPAQPTGPQPTLVEIHTPTPGPLELAERILLPAISPLATAAIVFVVAIFILLQREDLRDRIIRLFGSDDLHRTTAALNDAGYRLGRYYLSLLAVNTAFGLAIGTGLYFIGVPSPILWGIVAGLLRFIPYIGAFGGAAFPLLLAAAVDPGWTMVFETVALFLLIEPILGQVIEPMIYGHSTGLSPVSVVISAIFWGWIWGGIGLLLSMPLTLCLVVLGRHIERLEFLSVLLGDQPALSPAESLYQRMLVGDSAEVLEQAETLLKECSLIDYYDQVAIPGLRLAANDSLRGVLTDDQLEGVMDAVGGVIEELGDDAPAGDAPTVPAGSARVLCVAGGGALDEAVCAMLAQVLAKQGLATTIVPKDGVSRARIGALDLSGVSLICVSYIEGTNSLSALRYLVRRLRQRGGGAEIAVGLWAVERADLDEDRLLAAVGADRQVFSLAEAAQLCGSPARLAPELAA